MPKLKAVTERDEQNALLEAENEQWKLTKAEIAKRVKDIRRELEAAKARYEGALLDNYTDGIPRSLDIVDVNKEPYGAVDYLCPSLKGRLDRLQNETYEACLSDDVGELYFWSTEIAFQIGMLAGAIYADCPKETVDRFERGLAFALAARHWMVKE